MYKLTKENGIKRLSDGATLPAKWENNALVELDPHSPFVNELRDWIAAGNTPEPADVPSAAEVKARDLNAIEDQARFKQRGWREWFLTDAVRSGFITETILDPATPLDEESEPFKSFSYMIKANILQERAVRARKALL
jgi:hypothetical protein